MVRDGAAAVFFNELSPQQVTSGSLSTVSAQNSTDEIMYKIPYTLLVTLLGLSNPVDLIKLLILWLIS